MKPNKKVVITASAARWHWKWPGVGERSASRRAACLCWKACATSCMPCMGSPCVSNWPFWMCVRPPAWRRPCTGSSSAWAASTAWWGTPAPIAVTDIGRNSLETELGLIQTNLCGAITTVNAAVEHFLPRGKGHIVGISSLAALQPMAQQAAYSASKAGFSMYLRTARVELRRKGIDITSILPGHLATDIVEGMDLGNLPCAVPAAKAADEIARLIERRVEEGVVPAFPWRLLKPLIGHLPERLAHY